MSDIYHACRWCKHYKNGCCSKQIFDTYDSISPIQLHSENGTIAQAIEEGFTELDFTEIINKLKELKLSKQKINEVIEVIYETVDEAKIEWVQEIDASITSCLADNYYLEVDELTIKEPESFYCKHWE